MTQQKVAPFLHCARRISASNGNHRLRHLRAIFAVIAFYAASAPLHGTGLQWQQINNITGSNDSKLASQTDISVGSDNLAGNAKPVAQVDVVELKRFSNAFNVLANDSDPDGDRLVLTDAMAEFGAVAFTRDGLIGYAQNHGAPRSDTVTYIASDGRGGFATGTLEIVDR